MKRFLLLSLFVVGLIQSNGDQEQDKKEQKCLVDNITAIVVAVAQGNYSQKAAEQEVSFLFDKYGKPAYAAIQNLLNLVEQKLSTN